MQGSYDVGMHADASSASQAACPLPPDLPPALPCSQVFNTVRDSGLFPGLQTPDAGHVMQYHSAPVVPGGMGVGQQGLPEHFDDARGELWGEVRPACGGKQAGWLGVADIPRLPPADHPGHFHGRPLHPDHGARRAPGGGAAAAPLRVRAQRGGQVSSGGCNWGLQLAAAVAQGHRAEPPFCSACAVAAPAAAPSPLTRPSLQVPTRRLEAWHSLSGRGPGEHLRAGWFLMCCWLNALPCWSLRSRRPAGTPPACAALSLFGAR